MAARVKGREFSCHGVKPNDGHADAGRPCRLVEGSLEVFKGEDLADNRPNLMLRHGREHGLEAGAMANRHTLEPDLPRDDAPRFAGQSGRKAERTPISAMVPPTRMLLIDCVSVAFARASQ